jgi:hypothetical protein
LNFHGLPRATADIDLFVSPDPENVARLKAALLSVFHDPAIEGISAEDLGGAYPALMYVPPEGEFHVDILVRLGEMWAYPDIEFEERVIEGVTIRIATPRMLFRMKRGTVRLQDRADAERLRRRFRIEEE